MPAVLFEKDGKIAYVTINRPEAMNALNRDVTEGLLDAWREIEGAPEIFVAIVPGTGGTAFAAIDGYCLAGGLVRALACDIRIASKNSQFGCPEVKWSLLHGFGAQIMPYTVHMSNMMVLLLTGEFIDADEAYRIGLISRVMSQEELIPKAQDIAHKICRNAPLAIKVTKELAQRRVNEGLEAGMRVYAALGRLIRATEDSSEGPKAFAEKRQAKFKGR